MYNSIILLISITSGFLMILVYTSINLSVFINLPVCDPIDNIWKNVELFAIGKYNVYSRCLSAINNCNAKYL